MAVDKNKGITARADDYSQWYLDIVHRAKLAENSDVRGCMVIRPNGYAIWEKMQRALDRMFKDTGHVNAYFPLFIPKRFLEKEAEHVEGFAKECAVVTHHRLVPKPGGKGLMPDPSSALSDEEMLVIRPTSETIIWNTFKSWVQSYRDLPLLINQWANVVRWEMRTRLFLRTAEFLWQEGHTAHATQQEAEEETKTMIEVYRKFAEDWMAMPVLVGKKSEGQKFPGAVDTYCIEAMMQDRRALQAGTSHFLGQNFAKAFDVQFQDKDGKRDFAWATSWGVSTRLIGGLIMTHSDDQGLVVPPRLAPVHVVIMPMGKSEDERRGPLAAARELKAQLLALPREEFFGYEPLTVNVNEDFNQSPGFRFNESELMGVPIRVELGPRDLAKNTCLIARRDIKGLALEAELAATRGKLEYPLVGAPTQIVAWLKDIQANLFARAKKWRDEAIVEANTYEEFQARLDEGRFVMAHWDGTRATEDRVQNETRATIRCIPLAGKEEAGTCVVTGAPSERRVVFARAY